MTKRCRKCLRPTIEIGPLCVACKTYEEESDRRRVEAMQRQANDAAMNTALALAIVPLFLD